MTLPPRSLLLALIFATAVLPCSGQHVPIVPLSAQWKFSDAWTDLGTSWSAVNFNDSAWPSGVGEFGYGDADERTILAPPPGTVTTYFRHTFTVPNAAAYHGLRVRLKRDDGAVVWLNGVPQILSNFSTGLPAFNTPAGFAINGAAEGGYATFALSPQMLNSGTNVLAVELHQAASDGGDASFSLSLDGLVESNLVRGPYLNSGSPTSVVVCWRTNIPAASVVNFGATPAQLTSFVSDPTETTEHAVTLTGLTPNTRYFYQIADAAHALTGGDADTYFDTAPLAGTVKPTRVWVLGDCGTSDGSLTSAARRVADAYKNSPQFAHPDVWLLLGDNAYGSGTDLEYQRAIFDTYGDFLRNTIIWSTMGNHEAYNGLPTFPYYDIFNFPMNAEAGGVASGSEHYYSFDHANIHFVCLDSYTPSLRAAGNAQAQWLAADLAATTQKWIVAFYHHPPYTKGTHDSDAENEHIEMRENILPILEAGGVDLVLGGHSHVYERSYLLDGHYGDSSTLTPAMKLDAGDGRDGGDGAYGKDPGANNGAVYTVAGHSGYFGGGSLDHPAHFIGLATMGSFFFDVNGDRLDATMIDINGNIRDTFTISKAPLLTVAASAPSTAEKGDSPVHVTVSRTRGLDQQWTVPLALTGSAAAGSDFSGAPASVTLGVGVPAVTFQVNPRADNLAEGTECAEVAAQSGSQWRLNSCASCTSILLIDPPNQAWLASAFGAQANNATIAGPMADPDRDGLPNILERALGQSPHSASSGPKPSVADGCLALEFFQADNTADLTFTVKASSDLKTWSAANLVEVERIAEPGGTRVRVRDFMPVSAGRRFLRLEVND